MSAFIKGFGQALGEGLSQGIAIGILYILLIFLIIIIVSSLLGFLFLILAIIFYKKRKRKLFLTFGIISDLFLSFIIAIFSSAIWKGNATLPLLVGICVFILGIALTIKFYKKIALSSAGK